MKKIELEFVGCISCPYLDWKPDSLRSLKGFPFCRNKKKEIDTEDTPDWCPFPDIENFETKLNKKSSKKIKKLPNEDNLSKNKRKRK